MDLTVVSLSCLLLAQTAAEAPLVPVQSGERRASPADLVAQALAPPQDAALTGQPLTLLTALSSARDTRQQLEVTHAYWRLTRAVAEYRFALEEYVHLRQIRARPEDGPTFQTAFASAAATWRMAELSAVSAQHDLAEAAGLPATAPLPLPADLPHVGTYRTYFDEVFSKRNPPDRARLIHRKLPIRRQAIEVRNSAVQAAQDALEAAADAYRLGTTDLELVLWSLRRLSEQYRALLTSVCNYNHEIVDYALAVAGPQDDERVVVDMLIMPAEGTAAAPAGGRGETTQPSAVPLPFTPGSGVRPATLDTPAPSPDSDQPATLSADGRLRSLGDQTPTLAPAPEGDEPSDSPQPPSATPPDPAEESTAEGSDPAVPSGEDESDPPPAPEQPGAPLPPQPPEPIPRASNKPTLDEQADSGAVLAFYPALADASPAARAKLLSEELHAKRNLPEDFGEPIELSRCLAEISIEDRRDLIAAYWRAAQKSAECEALACHSGFLEDLVLTTFERRGEPLGAEAMLELRAAQLSVEGDSLRAQLDLLDAQFELAQHAHRPLDWPWLLPATIPRSDPFLLNLEAQARELAESWPLRRLSAVIPALAEGVRDRAAAVVQADTARATATAAYREGCEPIVPVLDSIDRQSDQTLAFLRVLTEYNQTIAEYSLAVLPPNVSGDQLAQRLGLVR
jgi:hypothetical protein